MALKKGKIPKIELLPKDCLEFIYDKSKAFCDSSLTIRNASNHPIFYKLKTSFPKDFSIPQPEGMVLPQSSFTIMLHFRIAVDSLERIHKFLLQTVPASKEQSADWKSSRVHEYKLMARFVNIQSIKIEPEIVESSISEGENQGVEVLTPPEFVELIQEKKPDNQEKRFNILQVLAAFLAGSLTTYFSRWLYFNLIH
jgi:hypothetical protein